MIYCVANLFRIVARIVARSSEKIMKRTTLEQSVMQKRKVAHLHPADCALDADLNVATFGVAHLSSHIDQSESKRERRGEETRA
jgi:hypothetical protein